jgi:Ca2+-binding RTX toxin-like protein
MSNYRTSYTTSYVPQSSDNTIDALLGGIKWGGSIGTGVSLTFSFPWTTNSTALWQTNYSYSNEPTAFKHYGLNTAQQTAAAAALQNWANVANLTFTQIAESGSEVGDIRLAFSSAVANAGAWGWCYYPDGNLASGGDVWIATGMSGDNMNFSPGGYGYMALMHELGHGLGLKHPGNYGSGDSGPYLQSSQDNKLYSIMSYNDLTNNWWYDTQTHAMVWIYEQTPMIYDIAAIQYIYGANMSYHASDDVYTFEDGPFRMTIWDAGGNDTISIETSTRGSLIDLHEGSFSSIQTSRFYSENGISTTYDGSYNLGIAYGAVIENAFGGSGDDKLIGNDVDNVLIGNGGNDTIYGNGGNDTIDGGSGTNILSGGTGDDIYILRGNNDTVIENMGEGTDVIQSYLTTTTLQSNVENLQIMSAGSADGYGNSLDNFIYAGSGNNIIDGRDGNDTVLYLYAASAITVTLSITTAQTTGGSGIDTLISIENLIGSNYDDTLSGDSGDNIIRGYDGNDTIDGGAGNDTMDGGNGIDTLSYKNATSGVTVYLSTTKAQNTGGSGTDTIYNFENITGSNYNDILVGNISGNVINGLDGNDLIYAGTSSASDTYNGGNGIDTLSYKNATSGVTVYLSTTAAQNTGGSGTDTIYNFENITGSNYDDILVGNISGNVINGLDGNDLIYAGTSSASDTYNGGNGIDTLSYKNATSGITVYLSTTSAQNTGGSGTDTIYNIENITGSNYNDVLVGTIGNNVINGLSGNDLIKAGAGNDTITGGNGADIFVFNTTLNATSNVDTITDFVAVDDTIQLSQAIFTALSTGTLSAANFVASASGTAVDGNDYILYNTTTGALYYDADGAGGADAVQFAILGTSSHPSISNADFVVA